MSRLSANETFQTCRRIRSGGMCSNAPSSRMAILKPPTSMEGGNGPHSAGGDLSQQRSRAEFRLHVLRGADESLGPAPPSTSGSIRLQNLSFPTKVSQAGKVALEQARATGKRFVVQKFDLQRKVLTAYLELAMHEEKIRIQSDNVSLLKLLAQSAADRVQVGGNQQDLLRAQTQYRLAENELATMGAQQHGDEGHAERDARPARRRVPCSATGPTEAKTRGR